MTERGRPIQSRILRPFAASLDRLRSEPTGLDPTGLELHVSLQRHESGIAFTFALCGATAADLEELVIPPVLEEHRRCRRDELWKHTCFEVFIAAGDRPSYIELNVAPSGDWNAYVFDDYRVGMRPLAGVTPLLIGASASGGRRSWRGALQLDSQASENPADAASELQRALRSGAPLMLGATAVLEYVAGERAYWALVHTGTQPDFHRRDSFALRL